jgi:hypothetical protein
MYQVHFRVAGWSTGCGMDVETTEISTKVKGFVDGEVSKVLVSECNDFALCDKSG